MKRIKYLKTIYLIGAIVNGAIAANRSLTSLGFQITGMGFGITGSSGDYPFYMYTSLLFILACAMMIWGFLNPVGRKVLLPLTSALLFLSIVLELTLYADYTSSLGLIAGIIARLVLISILTFSYFLQNTLNPSTLMHE